ncbi:MAG: DUF983 domain-containing protein [Ferruginibacter sp.]
MNEKRPVPGYLWSILTMRCPRCRTGPMFTHTNPYKKLSLKYIFDMPVKCMVCSQKFDLEPGFWYGTGYVSYALAVALSVATFIAWYVLFGVSTDDNRIFYWLIVNAIILIILQPWIMRLSRSIYIRFFVSYDDDYHVSKPVEFK